MYHLPPALLYGIAKYIYILNEDQTRWETQALGLICEITHIRQRISHRHASCEATA